MNLILETMRRHQQERLHRREQRVARAVRLRDQIQELREGIARLEAAQQVERWRRATQKSNGGGIHLEELALQHLTIPAPRAKHADRAGGRHRPDAWLYGHPIYREEES